MARYHTKSPLSLRSRQIGIIGVLVVMVGTSVYLANNYLSKYQSLNAGAAAGHAALFFDPASLTISPSNPNGLTNLWVTTDKKTAFVDAELTFDQTKVKLGSEIVLANAGLSKVYKVTSMTEANNTGKISLVVMAPENTLDTAPSGSFKLADLKFVSTTSTTNLATNIGIVTATSQLVDNTTVPFVLTATPATLSINPVTATPVPTTVPTPVPTAVPTLAPTPKPTVTPSPTPKPTVTPTTAPTAAPTVAPTTSPVTTDSTAPTLSLTTGKFWGYNWINAKASDTSGLKSIVISRNGVVKKTCTSSNSCLYFWQGQSGTTYSMQVTATDNSAKLNTTTKFSTVN